MFSSHYNLCSNNACLNNAKCLLGYAAKNYLCVCASGYTGEHCEKGNVKKYRLSYCRNCRRVAVCAREAIEMDTKFI